MIKLTPIKPKRPFLAGVKQFERELNIAQDDAADYTRDLLEKTVTTWNHSVTFYVRKLKSSRSIGTSDKVWNMLDKGTRAHPIRPNRAATLRFKVGGFKAKTRPRAFASSRGAKGREWRSSGVVAHPGTQPREWSDEAGQRGEKELGRNIRRAAKGLFG